MRLKDWEIKGIIEATEEVFLQNNISLHHVELHLYGSRVEDHKKGGDIDLLFRVPNEILKKVEALSLNVNISIQKRIGEQKIDILLIDQKPPKDPFHRMALKKALLLKQWT